MNRELIACLMTCGPAALLLAAWVNLYRKRKAVSLARSAWIALSIVTANAALAAGNFTYYHLRPVLPPLPPWKDPEILNYATLFFLAPIGMIIGLVAAGLGAPKWLVIILELASLPLLVTGYFGVISD